MTVDETGVDETVYIVDETRIDKLGINQCNMLYQVTML